MEQGVNYKNGNDFMDALLEIYNGKTDQASIARDIVKSLLMGMNKCKYIYINTSSVPSLLVRSFLGCPSHLGAIKEPLLCHPPFPLLVPRLVSKDVQLEGFDISAGTVVMINAWTIGRDPMSWDEPDEFVPERFLNSSVDFKGLDFDFIPFGVGRRGCPGISFASGAMEFLLANLVQKFVWKLGNGVEAEDLDMSESSGITVHRGVPLLVVPTHSE
ncbi:hypothetical protein OROMI_008285 [Orobanche minor]